MGTASPRRPRSPLDAAGNPQGTLSDPYEHVVNQDLVGAALEMVHQRAFDIINRGEFLLTVGGDHSIASGTISAAARKHPDLAVIWVDAHGDANTPITSPSKHYHGMPVAHLLGWFEKNPRGF